MYCKKCGNEIEDDSVYCNFCGDKIDKKNIESKNKKETKKIKSKPKFLSMIILIILIFSLFGIGFLINKNIIKNKTVNEVPNHYLSFGSISRSTDDNGKTFSVEVTPKVPLFEISIHVYIYKFDKLLYDANYINDVDVRTTGTYVEIPFAKDELINSQYTYLFYGTGKTHEPLPKIDYASVSFLNYDGSLYEKMDVEKNYGKVWTTPVPIRDGYEFVGWFYDESYTKPFKIWEQYSREEGQNLSLYSKWIKI